MCLGTILNKYAGVLREVQGHFGNTGKLGEVTKVQEHGGEGQPHWKCCTFVAIGAVHWSAGEAECS